ncbi:hypothetical protein LCGC14_2551500 [marine sediment metagenome]|uniref:TIGR04255 family protein n=1 Tax=marine sediment metagenome TaxID=412755 RepID=A0A0F9BAM9_9ZZZZ
MNKLVDITEDLLKENFKTNYLIQVAYEIRFPTDLTIKNKIPEFQGSIKDNFSIYEEGYSFPLTFQPKEDLSNLMNYKFLNENKSVELYLNNYTIFGLRTKNYPGYKIFLKNFMENVKRFIEISNVNKITRLGIRYINSIQLEEDFDESNQLKNKYVISLLDEKYGKEIFDSQRIDLRYHEKEFEIHQQFIFRKNPNNFYELLIDLDNSLKDSIKMDLRDIEDKLNKLHYLIKTKFFEMITDHFLMELRKEVGD